MVEVLLKRIIKEIPCDRLAGRHAAVMRIWFRTFMHVTHQSESAGSSLCFNGDETCCAVSYTAVSNGLMKRSDRPLLSVVFYGRRKITQLQVPRQVSLHCFSFEVSA